MVNEDAALLNRPVTSMTPPHFLTGVYNLNEWANHGAPFTATNTTMIFPEYFDVDNWNSLYFRLKTTP